MKILIIDDNRLLAESIKAKLSPAHIVDSAHTAHEGIEAAGNIQYGLILLDLCLPDLDGLEVCRQLRKAKISTPILVLTANKEPAMSVQLLNAGADDYLVKPFNGEVLKAHIAAILRRGTELRTENIINVDDLSINITRREVSRSGKEISLRRKEFDILEYLIVNRGRTLTRAMILDHVWESGTEGWNNTVDVHIKHLRDKIDRPFNNPLIKTSYGIGYTFKDKV